MINSSDVLPDPEIRLSLRGVKHRNIQNRIDEENLLNNNNGVICRQPKLMYASPFFYFYNKNKVLIDFIVI